MIDAGELYARRTASEFAQSFDCRENLLPDLIPWDVDPAVLTNWGSLVDQGHMICTDEFPVGSTHTPETIVTPLLNAFDHSEGSVSTRLYRIAVNHCIDRNRRTGFRRFLGLSGDRGEKGDPLDSLPDPGPGAERSLAATQALAAVRLAITRLPDRQRQALLLQVVAEMDHAAIALELGTGKGAVEQLLVRARATLRRGTGLDLTGWN